MRGIWLLIALAVLIWAASMQGEDRKTETARAERPEMSERFVELRDEAIRNIGWVAGNARGQAIWPEVRPHVGRDGEYYEAFVSLSSGRADDETEAMMNVSLYNDWVERGEERPFSPAEAMSRIERVQQIAAEMTRELESAAGG